MQEGRNVGKDRGDVGLGHKNVPRSGEMCVVGRNYVIDSCDVKELRLHLADAAVIESAKFDNPLGFDQTFGVEYPIGKGLAIGFSERIRYKAKTIS